MSYEKNFLLSLFLTLLVEIPVLVLLMSMFAKKAYTSIGLYKIILIGVIASTLTLPYLWFVLPSFVADAFLFKLIGETLVILVEALLYYKLLKIPVWQALLFSLLANLLSILLGLLRYFFY